MSDDLVAFLRDRLDEDAAVAHDACVYATAEWRLDPDDGDVVLLWPPESQIAEWEDRKGLPVAAAQWRGVDMGAGSMAPHVARHDPARVLREVEAKRRIIAEYERYAAERRRAMGGWDSPEISTILIAFAAVYADHPHYREEWKP